MALTKLDSNPRREQAITTLVKQRSSVSRAQSQMVENNAFIKPTKKDRDSFWYTKVPKPAVHVKRIQIVLKGFSHHLHQPPNRPGSSAAQVLSADK